MFDDQQNCQAFVGSVFFPCKPARMRVALSATAGTPSALAPLLIKETVFFLSEYRQASERQELAHKSTCPAVVCTELQVAVLDVDFPFLCGFGAGVFVALTLTLLSPGSRIVLSYPGEPDRLFERFLGWPIGDGTCWVSIGGVSTFTLEDLGSVAACSMSRDSPRSVVNLEQIVDARVMMASAYWSHARGESTCGGFTRA